MAGVGHLRGPGQLPAVREQGEVAGEGGAPRIPQPSPLPRGQHRAVGGRPPLLPAGGHTSGRGAGRGTGLGEKQHPGDRHPVVNPSLPAPPALSLR